VNEKMLGKHLSEVSEAMTLLVDDEVGRVVDILEIVKKAKGTVYVCGNGGSHATAGHFVNDLVKQLRMKAVCLGDMSSAVYAYGNDNGWDNMFSDLLDGMVTNKDCVIGISCSGNSENVVRALDVGARKGALTVCLTGPVSTSRVHSVGLDAAVHVYANDIRVQEDLHLMVCHAIVRMAQGKI
jgi:D-sedoheptulose 7-phosphate isomerase